MVLREYLIIFPKTVGTSQLQLISPTNIKLEYNKYQLRIRTPPSWSQCSPLIPNSLFTRFPWSYFERCKWLFKIPLLLGILFCSHESKYFGPQYCFLGTFCNWDKLLTISYLPDWVFYPYGRGSLGPSFFLIQLLLIINQKKKKNLMRSSRRSWIQNS